MKKRNLWKKTIIALAAALAITSAPVTGTSDVQAASTLVWPVVGHTAINNPYHDGGAIDISDSTIAGATVVAAMSGTVVKKTTCGYQHYGSYGDCNGFGTGIVIKGTDGRFYQYAHMKAGSIPNNINVNTYVAAGTAIGAVGTTGYASGNHLHFGISVGSWDAKSGIDPEKETYGNIEANVSYGTLSTSSITTSNAVISASVSNPTRATVTTVGAYIYNASGTLIKTYSETCGGSWSTFTQALNLNTEAKLALSAGTKYTVKFYAIAGSKTFYSNSVSFTTKQQSVNVTYSGMKTTSITKNNAVLTAKISNPYGANITTVGARIYNAKGKLIKTYTEKCGRTLKSFNQSLNIQKEAKLTLSKNTTYKVQFYAVAGGKTFYGSTIKFTTKKK